MVEQGLLSSLEPLLCLLFVKNVSLHRAEVSEELYFSDIVGVYPVVGLSFNLWNIVPFHFDAIFVFGLCLHEVVLGADPGVNFHAVIEDLFNELVDFRTLQLLFRLVDF